MNMLSDRLKALLPIAVMAFFLPAFPALGNFSGGSPYCTVQIIDVTSVTTCSGSTCNTTITYYYGTVCTTALQVEDGGRTGGGGSTCTTSPSVHVTFSELTLDQTNPGWARAYGGVTSSDPQNVVTYQITGPNAAGTGYGTGEFTFMVPLDGIGYGNSTYTVTAQDSPPGCPIASSTGTQTLSRTLQYANGAPASAIWWPADGSLRGTWGSVGLQIDEQDKFDRFQAIGFNTRGVRESAHLFVNNPGSLNLVDASMQHRFGNVEFTPMSGSCGSQIYGTYYEMTSCIDGTSWGVVYSESQLNNLVMRNGWMTAFFSQAWGQGDNVSCYVEYY